MRITEINPYIRAAQIQRPVLEGDGERMAYDYRIFYILDGSGQIIIEDRPCLLRLGTMIFIPPEIGYYFVGKMKVAVLNFDLSRGCEHKAEPICPPPASDFNPELRFDTERCPELNTYFILPDALHLHGALLDIVEEWNQGGDLKDASTSALLKYILVSLLKNEQQKKSTDDVLCQRIAGYIKLHAAEIRGLGDLGEAFGYHPDYLGSVYKRQTGRTLHGDILAERLLLGKRYLTQTSLSVEEIALELGFSSRAHFCSAFKKATSTTPIEYRKR